MNRMHSCGDHNFFLQEVCLSKNGKKKKKKERKRKWQKKKKKKGGGGGGHGRGDLKVIETRHSDKSIFFICNSYKKNWKELLGK